jgi:sugar O-acyltransferase (sialic acid O-acetyltransferase NeuD family)
MGEPLIIFGAGGLGRETACLARRAHREVVGYLDDDETKWGHSIAGISVLGGPGQALDDVEIIVALGNPRVRRSVVRQLSKRGARFATLVDPQAIIGERVTIGAGTQIQSGCILTCDIAIGEHCVLGIGSQVSHDCRLGNFATIAPGVTLPGSCELKDGAEVAIGATMPQKTTMEAGSMLGMGAVLTKNLSQDHLAFGVPARERRNLTAWDDT